MRTKQRNDCEVDDRTPHALGVEGEEIAAHYLKQNRYTVMDKNARFGRDEIDIVAFDRAEKMIAFVEVKTRSAYESAYPMRLSVDKRKKRALRRAINKWCIKHRYDGPARIDVVCVFGGRVVEHNKELGAVF